MAYGTTLYTHDVCVLWHHMCAGICIDTRITDEAHGNEPGAAERIAAACAPGDDEAKQRPMWINDVKPAVVLPRPGVPQLICHN